MRINAAGYPTTTTTAAHSASSGRAAEAESKARLALFMLCICLLCFSQTARLSAALQRVRSADWRSTRSPSVRLSLCCAVRQRCTALHCAALHCGVGRCATATDVLLRSGGDVAIPDETQMIDCRVISASTSSFDQFALDAHSVQSIHQRQRPMLGAVSTARTLHILQCFHVA